MFSCCCAKIDFSWTPVCGCYGGKKMCNATCLHQSMTEPDTYHEESKVNLHLFCSLFLTE